MSLPTIERRDPLFDDHRWLNRSHRATGLRTFREFAEQEIIIPDGPAAGTRYSCQRQPYAGLWLDELQSDRFNRFVATGPSQSGKTLTCFIVPLLYHLFEIGETVICGLPDMDMANDKWREDILPVIQRSRYADLLPRSGTGSRGGRGSAVQFRNGATLKFMSGGGSDKERAAFTARVLVVTETDGLDTAGAASREADKLEQLEARTLAFDRRKRVYLECTVSTEQGRTWREYEAGSHSRIVCRCPHCGGWVTPEREHFGGWQGAESEHHAREAASFGCPDCGETWSEANRRQANLAAKLVHDGQEVTPEGEIVGEPRRTDTLGFRWSAVNNLFLEQGTLGALEWKAAREVDEENAERKMRQFIWCLPAIPLKLDLSVLTEKVVYQRMAEWPRGVIPPGTACLTAGIDVGKWLLHWVLCAWKPDATGHIVDYGVHEVRSEIGTEAALSLASRELKDFLCQGWEHPDRPGVKLVPQQIWQDAGYETDTIYGVCRQEPDLSHARHRPCLGRSVTQQLKAGKRYETPPKLGTKIKHIGEEYHLAQLVPERIIVCEINVDHWKTWVQSRLNTSSREPGCLTFFKAPPQEHRSLVAHVTAENKYEEFVPGKGIVTRWHRVHRNNHWLDALVYASAASHFCGIRLRPETPTPAPVRRNPYRLRTPDGQPYLISQRKP